jgi:Uncharacterised nucleotidyltransferase
MKRWQIFDELCGFLRAGLHHTPAPLTDNLPWEQLIEASSYHYVTPFLAWSLQDNGKVDPEVEKYLAAVLLLNAQRNQQLILVIRRVAQALNAIGIVPILFKGAAHLVSALYPSQGLRVAGDIDLLLPVGRALDIGKALKQAGLSAEETPVLVKVENPNLPHFRDPASGAILDIQNEIAPRQWQAIVEPVGFEARCQLITLSGAEVRIPGPADLVAHAIVHNQIKDKYYRRNIVQLRQLLDLAFLCDRYEGEIDWVELESRFEKAGNAPVLSTNFHFVEALLYRDVPKFKCPPRPFALESLRARIENPQSQRLFLLTELASHYAARLRAQPLSDFKLLNGKAFAGHIRQLADILRAKKKW